MQSESFEPPEGSPDPDSVTIAIPTYNRSELLRVSLASALAQDHPDVRVVVLDNASTDDTREVVGSFADKRVTYLRSDTNLGMLSNWNRAIETCTTAFLAILQDDDVLHPEFVRKSLVRLKEYPRAGFSYAPARYMYPDGSLGQLNCTVPDDPDLVDGKLYLDQVIRGRGWTIGNISSMLFRRLALAEAGLFDSPHSRHSLEYNLFFRLAARFDVVPVPEVLVYERIHPEAVSELAFRSETGTGHLGYTAERIDALAYLLQSERAQDPVYRKWLSERLLALNARQSYYAYSLLPDLYWNWQERLRTAHREIVALVPPGAAFVLVDEDQWATGGEVAGRRAIPFSARDGVYWGPPQSDERAISELEALRRSGIGLIVFAWPAFWWLEHYAGLEEHLHTSGRRVHKSSRLIAFRLGSS